MRKNIFFVVPHFSKSIISDVWCSNEGFILIYSRLSWIPGFLSYFSSNNWIKCTIGWIGRQCKYRQHKVPVVKKKLALFLTSLFLSNTATVNIFFGLKLDLKLQGNLMFQIEKMCSMQLENAKCTKMCQNNRLDCGHVCRLKCHVKKIRNTKV